MGAVRGAPYEGLFAPKTMFRGNGSRQCFQWSERNHQVCYQASKGRRQN